MGPAFAKPTARQALRDRYDKYNRSPISPMCPIGPIQVSSRPSETLMRLHSPPLPLLAPYSFLRDLPDDFWQQVVFGFLDSGV